MRLAGLIDWVPSEAAFGPLHRDRLGRCGVPTRLMVGQHLLKHRYGRRNAAEWTFSRHKRVLGGGLRSRGIEAQRAETSIATRALNRMAELGMPRAQRRA